MAVLRLAGGNHTLEHKMATDRCRESRPSSTVSEPASLLTTGPDEPCRKCPGRKSGSRAGFRLDSNRHMHQLHFGRLDTAWNGNCSGLHIYNDTGKLVLRKPDGRAPADTFTLPKALDAINCLAKLGGTLISFDSHGANHQIHFGRLDTGMETAPAYTSTMILENWYSVSRMTVLRLTHLHCRRHWMP